MYDGGSNEIMVHIEALLSKEISARDFIAFFESASDVDMGTCADVMKHVSVEKPEILMPYIDVLVKYVNKCLNASVSTSHGHVRNRYWIFRKNCRAVVAKPVSLP